jgi:PspAB-like protein
MSILETLFGRQKPVPPGPEKLFAMSTAQLTLETDQHLTAIGSAALCFKGVASGPFAEIQSDLDQLLQIAGHEDGLTVKPFEDPYGYRWLIFGSKDFQALVTTIHVASQTLIEHGYGTQLLFAIFRFDDTQSRPIYWIYNYKRGTFYPFVPRPDSHDSRRQRDNAEEMRIATAMGKELPVEREYERWFPVWDLPM